MREDAFIQWHPEAAKGSGSLRSCLSVLRRIEKAHGDLDRGFARDRLQSVMAALSYSTEDLRRGRQHHSGLLISGNVYEVLASARTHLRSYIDFASGVPLRAALPDPALTPTLPVPDRGDRLSLERDLEAALRRDPEQIEAGLQITDGGLQRQVPSGRIDILARDRSGGVVVIEVKAVTAGRDAVAQALAYMGDLAAEERVPVRGLLVAPGFDPRAVAAARMAPGLKLCRFHIRFEMIPVM